MSSSTTFTWLEVSASALKHNIDTVKTLIGATKLMAVVKANAYGHGLLEVARVVAGSVDYLAVSNTDEARLLRKEGLVRPILVLAYFPLEKEVINWAIGERVELPLYSLEQAEQVSRLVTHGELRVHVKVDTGMGRLGTMAADAVGAIKRIKQLPGIHIKGIFSHLADPFEHIHYTHQQLAAFAAIKNALIKSGLDSQLYHHSKNFGAVVYHIAKTSAILSLPESHHDAVRLGLGLYGLWPDKKLSTFVQKDWREFRLKPVLGWKAKIVQVKNYPSDAYIGYDCTYKTRRPTRLVILGVGYSAGYARGLSNRGQVLLKGKRCPIVGRICMDMTTVDVTDVERVTETDEAVLIGKQGDDELTADELADWAETSNYEIVTRINPLLERKIVS